MARAPFAFPCTFPHSTWPQPEKGTIMLSMTRLVLAAMLTASALPASAEDLPVLNVYTYESFAAEWGPGPQLKADFEQSCGCTVKFSAAEDAISTLRKVQLEGDATEADLVVGLDTATAGEARATGLFAEHGLTPPALALPEPWTDTTFVPFDFSYFAYVYDKTRLATPPTSFEDLIALPPSFKIVIQDPRSSTPGLGHLLWIEAAYGERAPEIWKGLKPHILTVTRGWSEAYGLFLDGEADMVLSYTTSPAYHAVADGNDDYAYAPFTEGHMPQIEIAGMLKSARQPELARAFLDYLMTPAAQKVIAVTNWMYPVVDLGADLPAAFGPKPAKVLHLDEAEITANSGAWVASALAALN